MGELRKVCFLQPKVKDSDVLNMMKHLEENKWDYDRTPMEFVRWKTPNMEDSLYFAIGNRRGSSLLI